MVTRPIPSRPFGARGGSNMLNSFIVILTCLYSTANYLIHVESAASAPLLGGQYVPTTDVGFVEDLTDLIEAIAAEPDATKGQLFYRDNTPGSKFSLESIGANTSSTILDTSTNPLYAIYLHGYYRSANGNGNAANQNRDNMMFLGNKVDYYGHTIITEEFTKASGYDSNLNAETIRVTNMWMATVQSLYDASALCHSGPDSVDMLTYINPIDKAAAFYYGTLDDEGSAEGGSLFAWAARTRQLFVGASGYNVNDAMKDGFSRLQATLSDCLDSWDADDTDEQEYEIDKLVNDMTNKMTVPLVQNLIYYANDVAQSDVKDTTTVDFLILYALATLPPLRVCDKASFDTLYSNFVTNAATLDTTTLTQSLVILFDSFTCLGVTCAVVGIPDGIIPPIAIDLPVCNEAPMDIQVAGYRGSYDRMLESAIVDLDVLTIGALVEIEADDAAQNVYWWNKFGLSLSQTIDDVSLSDMAVTLNHQNNSVAQNYDSEYTIDELVISVIQKTDDFSSASPVERREIVQVLLTTVILQINALDSMYNAIDNCHINRETSEWDKAVASLVGFLEGPNDGGSDRGILFYKLGQFLCENSDTCRNSDLEPSTMLMNKLEDGRDFLLSSDCISAQEQVYDIELTLHTMLIDAVAFYAKRIKSDPTNELNLALGYAYATALYPQIQFDRSEADTIIKNSIGTFGNVNSSYMDTVLGALKSYVEGHNGMNCDLIFNIVCDEFATTTSTMWTTITAMFTPSPWKGSGTYYPTYAPSFTAKPTGISPPSTHYPTYFPTVTAIPTFSNVLNGGVIAVNDGDISSPLYSGAYIPTSNINHILMLIEQLDEIQTPGTTKDAGVAFYTKEVEAGLSLQSLSTSSEWNYVININPLQTIHMFGLWLSEDGGNDNNGYSNKKFDDGDLSEYGNSIVMDSFNKNSGFDQDLTAETILVTNVWMAMVTELYKAVESCRDGSASSTEEGFNPVDHAAAFWFGSSKSSDGNKGASIHAWTARAGSNFINQSIAVNIEMITYLSDLQSNYAQCKNLPRSDADEFANVMSEVVLSMTRLMIIPLIQNFITDLATKSGKSANERDYLILYSLSLLPQLSICDEDALETLYSDLILNNAIFDASKFGQTLKLLQDRYSCLGIQCSLVGSHVSADETWPICVDTKDPDIVTNIAGYIPFSKELNEWSKIDLDVSTILSFLVMEANGAAFDVYKNGRNVMGNDGSYISLHSLKFPKHPDVIKIYNKFSSDYGVNYLALTESAIQGTGDFVSATPMQKSAAASLALVTIDLHIAILDTMYQSVQSCRDGNDSLFTRALMDRAVALTIGWAEGPQESGSKNNGYLFFQISQELCDSFASCDDNNNSIINQRLLAAFNNADGIIGMNDCDKLKDEVEIIETYLQTIIIDNIGINLMSSPEIDERRYLLAHVGAYSLLPFIRSVDNASANLVEHNLGSFPSTLYLPDGVETVASAIKSYIDIKGIDCSLLDSSICVGITSTDVTNALPLPNTSGLTLANGEYTPFTDVTELTTGLTLMLTKICNADDSVSAKEVYTKGDDNSRFILQDLSLKAKVVMSNEVLFNQYVYSFIDEVDKTDGSMLFDQLPAAEYSNTIVSDAIDNNIALGCHSIKVLSIWMWVVHKLNDSVEECRVGDSSLYGSIDEAAAFWIGSISGDQMGGVLYELAEMLEDQFSRKNNEYRTTLNREIMTRMTLAQTTYFVNNSRCKTDDNAVNALRKLVKEIISYMTAVLIQGFIHSMLEDKPIEEKKAFVELHTFAFLPHIASCGHDDLKKSLYEDLVIGSFDPSLTPQIISALHDQLDCLGLKCDDIGQHNLADASYPSCNDEFDMMGYAPINATKTIMPARLDLDAVAIHQLMSMEKYNIAKDIYMNGHTYYDYDDESKFGFVSFHKLTQSETIGETEFDAYNMYTNYLSENPGNFVNDFIISAFEKTDQFFKTTAKQRDLAVTTAIKSFISYMSALEALNLGVSSCDTNNPLAQNAWDGGTALLIGSIEGKGDVPSNDVNRTSDGRMFVSISNEVCNYFDTCNQNGISLVTENLLALLVQGQGYIKDSSCSMAKDILESIGQLCLVSLIQNAIYFSEESWNEDYIGAGYIAGMAVLPWVHNIDSEAAMVIRKVMRMRVRPFSITESGGSKVLDAFKNFLSVSAIECEQISNVHKLCDDPELPAFINPNEDTILSNGLYAATNYVTDRSTISLDIRDIEGKVKINQIDDAIYSYKNGANSATYNALGQMTGKRSISKFSTDAQNIMMKNPIYNHFLFGLADRVQEFRGRQVTYYADSMVLDLLLSNNRQQQLAAPNAMVILNVWMQVVQKIYSAYDACRSGEGDSSLFIDEAAAYWIGDSQDVGSSTQGYLMYALTEYVSQKYESIPKGSQSEINTRIIDLFNEAKSHITLTRRCSESPTSHIKLRSIVDEMISCMTVPLLRGLFYYLSVRDDINTKLYAASVLPLFSICSKSTYMELKEDLIDSDVIDVSNDYVFSRIRSMYNCLGLSCDLIGSMGLDHFTHCSETAHQNDKISGFSFVGDYDNIIEIDVTIHKIESFMTNGLSIFSTNAEDLFRLGFEFYQLEQHAGFDSSIKSLATSAGRELVPSYALFRRYFDDDVNYADTIIDNAFQKEGIFASATAEDRSKVISFSMRYMVTYMAVLEKLYTSLDLCRDSQDSDAQDSLDAAAAYFVGLSEGAKDGGTYDGSLLFMLANRLCTHFGTCSASSNAEVNENIISLFYAAQGEIDVGACDSLANTVERIENILTVPLIQGTLFIALENDLFISKVVEAEDLLPEGYVLAQSILPLIHDVDSSAASDIADVMIKGFPRTQYSHEAANHAKVFRAIQIAIPKMTGVDCSMIGTIAGVSFCSGTVSTTNAGSNHSILNSIVVLLGIAFLLLN